MDSSEAYSPHVYVDEVLATLLANAKEPSGVELSSENHQLAVGDSALICPSPLVGGEAKESGNGEVDEGFEGEAVTQYCAKGLGSVDTHRFYILTHI